MLILVEFLIDYYAVILILIYRWLQYGVFMVVIMFIIIPVKYSNFSLICLTDYLLLIFGNLNLMSQKNSGHKK